MTETLSSRLTATVKHLSEIAPPDLFAVFGAEQQRLAASDTAAEHVQVGAQIAPVKLPDATGAEVAVPGNEPTVIVFYRGAWCPYCNVALKAYRDELLPELAERGVAFVAISPQGPDGSLSVAETNALTFPVLTDTGSAFAKSLGLTFDLTDDVKQAQLAFGNDFETINSGGEWSLPKPTVLVVDAQGIVRYVDVRPDCTERTEPAAILEAVRALG